MRLEELDITIKEGVAHPSDTKDRDHGIHTRTEDIAANGLLHTGLAHNQNQGSYRHHQNLDGLRHRKTLYSSIYLERRTKRGHATKDDYQKHTQQEGQYRPLGTRIRTLFHRRHGLGLCLRINQTFFDTTLVDRIILQLLTNTILYERCYKNRNQRSWDADKQDILQLDTLTTQQIGTDNSSCSS